MAGRPAGFSDGESDDDDFGMFEAPAPLPKLRARPPSNPVPTTQVHNMGYFLKFMFLISQLLRRL